MVAALFVLDRGPYFDLADVDPWPTSRDARTYNGPWPVVAHPPCARWGRYWFGSPRHGIGDPRRYAKGDDGGCFAAALEAVRRFGGVLEHPAGSHAWAAHGLEAPARAGGWERCDDLGGLTCCVDQGHYGHPAQKATWLYYRGRPPRPLVWGKAPRRVDLETATSEAERLRLRRRGTLEKLSKRQRAMTPAMFRDLLLELARNA